MKREKILRDHYERVIYSEDQWILFESKRKNALKLLEMFTKEGLNPYIHVSMARGDIHKNSDIDIIFLQQIPSYQ
ncbi:MAG: DNA polymerase subunit beta, partial [Promethearchaeota archaeon]